MGGVELQWTPCQTKLIAGAHSAQHFELLNHQLEKLKVLIKISSNVENIKTVRKLGVSLTIVKWCFQDSKCLFLHESFDVGEDDCRSPRKRSRSTLTHLHKSFQQ